MPQASDFKLALVPLRGGSQGLPGKNLRDLAGKPLYRHAVDQALRTVGRCLITTDIEEILSSPLPPGCEAIRRPAELAANDTPMAPVIMHALQSAEMDDGEIVLLQATSPLRRDSDITEALAQHLQQQATLTISVTEADASIQKWGRVTDGLFQSIAEPELCFANRQALPPVYRPNGAIYIFNAREYLKAKTFPIHRVGAYVMPESHSKDIDTIDDFHAAAQALESQME